MSKVLQERGLGSLPSSTKTKPRDQVKSILTTIEADSLPIRRIGSPQYVVSTGQNRTLIYETRQTTIPFPSHLNGASISVMPLLTYLNLGLGELAHTKQTMVLADRTVKYPKGIAENILNMDAYRDEGMGDVIVGKPFLREVGIKARRFDGMITIYNGDDEVTYQMVRSHLRTSDAKKSTNIGENLQIWKS
ncbi:hypothetical protein Tco_0291966 [Tanacetum coccineum]